MFSHSSEKHKLLLSERPPDSVAVHIDDDKWVPKHLSDLEKAAYQQGTPAHS